MESAPFNPPPPGNPYAPPQIAQEAKPPAPHKLPPDRPAWSLLIVLGGVMLAANAAVVPLMDVFRQHDWGALWVYTCFGVICAEGGILSAGLAWGSGSFFMRLGLHWLAAAVLFLAWFIGITANEGMRPFVLEGVGVGLFGLPLVALAIQLPLWSVRSLFAWRIVRRDDLSPVRSEPPLAIRDLMVATVLVAVALTSARIVRTFNPHENDYWVIWVIVAASALGASTVSVIPVAWWIFRWPRGILGVLLTTIYALAAAVITCTVIGFIERSSRRWDMIGLATTLLACGLTLALAGLAAHRAGYRLQVGHGRAAL